MFVEYKFGCFRKQIRELLRKRLNLKTRIIYHKGKIEHHKKQINIIKKETLKDIEKDLNKYLKLAGN